MIAPRRARVRALAKINLDLRVLGKRPDGYHELRTIFQTISLADTIDITFTPERKTSIELEDALEIPDNLAARAARIVMEASGARGHVTLRLRKQIPMGGGLGGGSSDAAAILLALPVLTGRAIPLCRLMEVAQTLGSDVPFFLLGGRAAGIGRGSELIPLPDVATKQGLLLTPDVSISTAEAYARLSPHLTTESQQNKIFIFQSQIWDSGGYETARNDFETVVFARHRSLARLKKRLTAAGAIAAMMTGSGSALFGLFEPGAGVSRAMKSFEGPGMPRLLRFSLVSRVRYRSMWRRALEEHTTGNLWPPQSRYIR